MDIDGTYAVFSGLSHETTLRVTVRMYFEEFPSFTSENISMCTDSAAPDDRALQLYGYVLQQMAPGTPVGDNASGDWYKYVMKILGQVSQHLPALGVALEPVLPGAAMIGSLVDTVLSKRGYAAAKPTVKPKRNRKGRGKAKP